MSIVAEGTMYRNQFLEIAFDEGKMETQISDYEARVLAKEAPLMTARPTSGTYDFTMEFAPEGVYSACGSRAARQPLVCASSSDFPIKAWIGLALPSVGCRLERIVKLFEKQDLKTVQDLRDSKQTKALNADRLESLLSDSRQLTIGEITKLIKAFLTL
jgi:hypothetical protein